ncbi:S16 family serine protease [Thermococcus peptonophilus]|uniref:ATP-dependent protease n=1 Tax=Thermococcus peptonophilus TaxID=53952 RepID=A0A142CUM3_9EURY|nr:S16 family serine protease [Thermococcus peptonophilus]AMQ18475.1 ATP-dependent protease [Thermococcus peptonophilus]
MKRALSILLAAFLIASLVVTPVKAQCPSEGTTVVLKAPAVSKTPDGRLVGVATDFVITVAPGSGHVYVETWPLSEVDMQASARLAAQIAGKVTGKDMSKYDVFIQVKTDTPIIGGPSAGGTMTVGIIAALMGWKVNPKVMMTGMINPDGTIGPVGGILEKASAAASVGAKLFLIPQGQRIQVIQETQQKSIGGIVQVVQTKSEKVDVVEYAKERWGLEVKEVSDIYEAVYYFTGHMLPKPKAPANVLIDTSFLKDDAVKDYQNTTAYYESVKEKLKKSNVDYSTYTVLKEALDQAKAILDDAKEALDSGMYYTALSKDFQARIVLRHIDWYISVESPEDVANLLTSVNSYINQTESLVSSMEIRGMTMLQAVAAAEERVEDAKASLQEGWKYYYSADYWDAVDKAAYAYERAQTARFWAKLGERFAKGEVIDREELKDTARNYIDESSLIVTYIESMYGNVIGNDLLDTIQKAEQYYGDGKYSAAIFTAMEARVRGEVFLDTLGIDNETILREKLREMKEAAKTAIGIAQMNGLHPLLSVAYYEFAESYEKGNTTDDLVNAMIFYQYARESAGVFLIKVNESTPNVPSNETAIPALPTNTNTNGGSTSTPSATSTSTPSSGIQSVCGPAFILALALLPLLRKRR